MERWQQIESLFQEALERDPAERNSWLREACQGDSDLRREVASLLANHQAATDFKPWAAAAAEKLIDGPVPLEPGQCLGPYRIECFLAAGGMGKVYRATDTRLHRAVAIKVSAARFSERFEREARVIASLNHPNICQLYDVGPNYLVMEFVEGPTLAERIRKGALPLDEALAIARQIAEALEAAHEKGRVHRDLKPANIKITPDGVVKLLDFGLAKAAEEPMAGSNPSDSPTQTISATRSGTILGTAAYMSPEQTRGAAVDKRADIWAFGCVLYEMLSGKPAFSGETTTDILAAVLRAEPHWRELPAATPPRIHRLLRRCLERDRKQRIQAIGEARITIDAREEEATPQPAASQLWPWLAAVLFAIAFFISGVGWWRAARPAPLRPLVQLSANLPPDAAVSTVRGSPNLTLSPDGTRLALILRGADSKDRVAVRRLDQSEFATVSGTEGASKPFFSADSQWIGFFADGKLKKVAVQGGSTRTLCDAPALPAVYGASWGDDGNIIGADLTRLWRVSSGGGVRNVVMEPNQEKAETIGWPQVLPGSQAVLFASTSVGGGSFDDANIGVLSLKTGQRKTVLRGGFFGRYLATSSRAGYLVYMHQNTLYAAPFDLSGLAVTGDAQPVLEDVSNLDRYGVASFDSSAAPSGSGTFAYISSTGQSPWLIYWLDRSGKIEPILSTPGFYWTPRVSPDGNRLAFAIGTGPAGGSDLWVKDLGSGATTRLTSRPGWNYWPVWTPDGKDIVFAWVGSSARGLYWIRADGSGVPQRLTDNGLPYSFSPDGKRLTYEQISGHTQMSTAPVEGGREQGAASVRLGKPEPLLGAERTGAFSPDGRWLAYSSLETGTHEVYVRPYPGPGTKSAISTGFGHIPVWSPDGHELFFLGADHRITVVRYTVDHGSFLAEKPQVWSRKVIMAPVVGSTYDLSPDGKRFAVMLYPDGTAEPKPVTHATVLLNFFDELRRRVPAEEK
jgi:serine/threonine-protein kinase